MDWFCYRFVHRSCMPAPEIPQAIQETKNYHPAIRQSGSLFPISLDQFSVRDGDRVCNHRHAHALVPA